MFHNKERDKKRRENLLYKITNIMDKKNEI